MTDNALSIEHVSHGFGTVPVLHDVNLQVPTGEFVAIVGPSGCGKTTLLNVIAGHITPTTGKVERTGVLRTIYQTDGLFPWLTARQNIAMGFNGANSPTPKSAEVEGMLKLVGLSAFGDHFPHQLSGGMRQRVELARALSGKSDILLMDEPFSALDFQTRLRMRRELIRLLQEIPKTVIFVTHDIEEAVQLADRIVVLTDRPSTIQREIRVGVQHPRDPAEAEMLYLLNATLDALGLRDAATDIEALNVA